MNNGQYSVSAMLGQTHPLNNTDTEREFTPYPLEESGIAFQGGIVNPDDTAVDTQETTKGVGAGMDLNEAMSKTDGEPTGVDYLEHSHGVANPAEVSVVLENMGFGKDTTYKLISLDILEEVPPMIPSDLDLTRIEKVIASETSAVKRIQEKLLSIIENTGEVAVPIIECDIDRHHAFTEDYAKYGLVILESDYSRVATIIDMHKFLEGAQAEDPKYFADIRKTKHRAVLTEKVEYLGRLRASNKRLILPLFDPHKIVTPIEEADTLLPFFTISELKGLVEHFKNSGYTTKIVNNLLYIEKKQA